MSLQLTPMFDDAWSPFGSFNNDLRLMKSLLHADDSSRSGTPTVEPSYTYEATDKEATFEIEMPGVSKENISIGVDGQKLVVRGRRFRKGQGGKPVEVEQHEGGGNAGEAGKEKDDSVEVNEKEGTTAMVYLLEARLGMSADVDSIRADNCENGILTVYVPMRNGNNSRKIQIGM